MVDCSLDELVNKCPNVIIGKKDCNECKEAMCLLVHKDICFCYCPAPTHPKIMKEVHEKYGQECVPVVFYQGKYVKGGHKGLHEMLK